MRDFTQGSVTSHILSTATPGMLVLLVHAIYQAIDLYFVARLGEIAIAGVSAGAAAILMIHALVQVLTTGTIALVAQAVGRRDECDANVVLNQSLALSIVSGLLLVGTLAVLIHPYMRLIASEPAIIDAGRTFMLWVLPGFALSFPMAILSAALRAIGIVRASVAAYTLTIAVNAALAPVLVLGWGTGARLGVQGAGLATSIGILAGLLFLAGYFRRAQSAMVVAPARMRPRLEQWRRIVHIGLPSGGEFVISFLVTAVVYYAIRNLGTAAQAGYGIGLRVLQIALVPIVAIGGAVAPIVGQNLGGRQHDRVREALYKALVIGAGSMLLVAMLLQFRSEMFVGMFGADPATNVVAVEFLRFMSWTLLLQCVVTISLGVFQGLGNTVPALISGGTRFLAFAAPALALSARSTFPLELVWYLLIVSIVVQAIASGLLLRVEFVKRLSCGFMLSQPHIEQRTESRTA